MLTYDPFDHDLQADPWPTYARLREQVPLYRNEAQNFYALSRYADVSAAFRDSELFSNSHGPTLEQWSPEVYKVASFVAMDPPFHTRTRALVSAAFTPRRVAAMGPAITELARHHLGRALRSGGEFDFVTDYAAKVPVDVISTMIGVPEGDREQLRRWAQQVMSREDQGEHGVPEALARANAALAGYYTDLLAERRRRGADDLATALLHAEVDGARLGEEEIVPVLTLLGVGGNETIAKLVASAWHAAWANPDQRALAWAGDIDGWVEETLRWAGPGQMSARRLTRTTVLHGVTVPAGARMLLLTGSANRDPRVFPDPDRFDIGRDQSQAIPFAVGRHFCLGASLARLESRVMLRELVRTVGKDYDIDLARARRAYNPNVHGFAHLPTNVLPR